MRESRTVIWIIPVHRIQYSDDDVGYLDLEGVLWDIFSGYTSLTHTDIAKQSPLLSHMEALISTYMNIHVFFCLPEYVCIHIYADFILWTCAWNTRQWTWKCGLFITCHNLLYILDLYCGAIAGLEQLTRWCHLRSVSVNLPAPFEDALIPLLLQHSLILLYLLWL